MLGYGYMYYSFRNIPAVCTKHPFRSSFAVVVISLAFLGTYLICKHIMSPGELERFAEIPTAIVAAVCSVLYLFGQAAGFEKDWTKGQGLAEEHARLTMEIKKLNAQVTKLCF